MLNKKCLFVSATLMSFVFLHAQQQPAQDPQAVQSQATTAENIQTIDYLVPHISTVPANSGKRVELFVREKVESRRRGKALVVFDDCRRDRLGGPRF
jgi:hypothetical protein